MPCRAVGLRGINPEEFPQVRQGINVATPIPAAFRGVQAHLSVRGTQRGKPLQSTTGERLIHPDAYESKRNKKQKQNSKQKHKIY